MKTKKITAVPRLRFPEFRDYEDWKEVSLNNICHFVRGPFGGALKKDIFVEDGYAVYEQAHAIYGNFDSFRYFITQQKFDELKRFEVKADDLIMSCSGTMGKFSRIPNNPKKGVINQALLKLTVKKGYKTSFIKTALEIPSNQSKLLLQSAGGAVKNVVGVKLIKQITIFVPKLDEQQKIADCLSSLDDLINAENEQLDALQEYKAGLLQQLFPVEGETTPKLRFAEFKDDGDWEEVKLVDVAETSIGLVTTMTTSYVEKGIPLIRNSDIKPNAIRMTKLINLSKEFADKYENKKLLKNDIVTVHTGDIGVSAIVEQDLEGSLGFATLNTRVTSSNVSPEFVCWFFNSPEYKRFALSMATGDGRNNFNLRDFNKTILFIPDILEQQKVVDCLSSLDNLIQAKDEKIKILKEHKKGLMQQLFPVTDDK